jgi:4-amino-4-deoxy-L-arabinose transferase-like glycosyltransferase
MLKYKLNTNYPIIILISLAVILFHLSYIKELGFSGDATYYIEYSSRLFEKDFEPLMFRPFYYLYGNLAQKFFGLNDYSIKIFNIVLFGINSVLTFALCEKIFKKKIISIVPVLILFSNPSVHLEATTENTTTLATFLVLSFLLFFFHIKKNIEEKFIIYSIFFGTYAAAFFFTHEELIIVSIINSLLLFNRFRSKKKFFQFLIFQASFFLSICTIFILKFTNKSLIKNFISQALNVIPIDLNFFIRSKYHQTDYNIEFSTSNLLNFFSKSVLDIFPKYFINSYLILIIFILYIFLIIKNKYKNENLKILNINLIIYFFTLVLTIRAAPRLFITFYPIFYIIIFFAVNYILKFIKNENLTHLISSLLFVFIILFNLFNFFPKEYKQKITQDKLLFNHFKEKINNDNKLLLLTTIYDAGAGTGARKKINQKLTENYSLSSEVYFGKNAILFRNILRFEDDIINFTDYIKKNKIKYAIFMENYTEKAYTYKEFDNLKKLFPDKHNLINEVTIINNNTYNHLKLYGIKIYELFYINNEIETKLIENFSIKKEKISFFDKNKNSIKSNIYILEFK